jgi:hypothetical protein
MNQDPYDLGTVLDDLAANQEDGMTLEEAYERLSELHEATGADFHISLTASAHVVWNAEVRVTPVPHDPDTSDRSYVTFRAGPAEWALCQAVLDVLRWLAQDRPEYTDEPCLDCGNDDDTEGTPS